MTELTGESSISEYNSPKILKNSIILRDYRNEMRSNCDFFLKCDKLFYCCEKNKYARLKCPAYLSLLLTVRNSGPSRE